MGRKIILKESELISLIEKVVKEQSRLSEDKDWMQDVDKDIERRGTEGVFHDWCIERGYRNACSKECWRDAKDAGMPWSKRAGLAKAYCESR